MNYFNKIENVEKYRLSMHAYDNRFIINTVTKIAKPGGTLLELGMGTGLDLIALSNYYEVLGSDASNLFIDAFKKQSSIPVINLNAIYFNLAKTFDVIYSNKLLSYLNDKEVKQSLVAQAKHLNANGKLIATLWLGEDQSETYDELTCYYYSLKALKKLLPKDLLLEEVITYSELDKNDSIIIVCVKATIDNYLKQVNEVRSERINALIDYIQTKYPEAIASLDYAENTKIPTYKINNQYVAIASMKHHLTIHFSNYKAVELVKKANPSIVKRIGCVNIKDNQTYPLDAIKQAIDLCFKS